MLDETVCEVTDPVAVEVAEPPDRVEVMVLPEVPVGSPTEIRTTVCEADVSVLIVLEVTLVSEAPVLVAAPDDPGSVDVMV